MNANVKRITYRRLCDMIHELETEYSRKGCNKAGYETFKELYQNEIDFFWMFYGIYYSVFPYFSNFIYDKLQEAEKIIQKLDGNRQ